MGKVSGGVGAAEEKIHKPQMNADDWDFLCGMRHPRFLTLRQKQAKGWATLRDGVGTRVSPLHRVVSASGREILRSSLYFVAQSAPDLGWDSLRMTG